MTRAQLRATLYRSRYSRNARRVEFFILSPSERVLLLTPPPPLSPRAAGDARGKARITMLEESLSERDAAVNQARGELATALQQQRASADVTRAESAQLDEMRADLLSLRQQLQDEARESNSAIPPPPPSGVLCDLPHGPSRTACERTHLFAAPTMEASRPAVRSAQTCHVRRAPAIRDGYRDPDRLAPHTDGHAVLHLTLHHFRADAHGATGRGARTLASCAPHLAKCSALPDAPAGSSPELDAPPCALIGL